MSHTEVNEESTRMLSVLQSSLNKENLDDITNFLEKTKEGKKGAQKRKNGHAIVDRIQKSVSNCLNSGPCSEWLSQMQSVDFEKIGKPTTHQAVCLYENTKSLVVAISSIAEPKTKGSFWNSIDTAHIAAKNLNNFYTKGIHF